LAAARTTVSAAQQDLEDLARTLKETHPDVVAAKQRVAHAEAQVQALLRAADASPPEVGTAGNHAALTRRLQEIDRDMRRLAQTQAQRRGPVSRARPIVPERETAWQRLRAALSEAHDRHDAITARLLRAQILANSVMQVKKERLHVIDPPYLPSKPSGLGRSIILLMGLALTGALALAVIVILTLLDDRVHGPLDLARLELAPLLVEVPKGRSRGQRRARS
jgi:uncharacterized protein involved in exopolysaccharide biosynthesis